MVDIKVDPNDADMVRVVEGVLGFYGGCAARDDRDMAVRVLSGIAGELQRRAADEVRHERARQESRAAMQALLGPRVASRLAVRQMVRGRTLGTDVASRLS